MGAPFAQLTVEDGWAHATVSPAHAHALCAGHFPGDPLVPGAYLAELMADVATRLLDPGDSAAHQTPALRRCVFLTRVRPTHEIVIAARRSAPAVVEAEVTADGTRAAYATLDFGTHP